MYYNYYFYSYSRTAFYSRSVVTVTSNTIQRFTIVLHPCTYCLKMLKYYPFILHCRPKRKNQTMFLRQSSMISVNTLGRCARCVACMFDLRFYLFFILIAPLTQQLIIYWLLFLIIHVQLILSSVLDKDFQISEGHDPPAKLAYKYSFFK